METTKYKTSKPGSFIEVSLSYYKGDDYGSRKRGYYASFNLVALSDCGGGVTIRKFCPADGLTVFFGEIPRKSSAAEREARQRLADCLPRYLQRICNKNNIDLSEEVIA